MLVAVVTVDNQDNVDMAFCTQNDLYRDADNSLARPGRKQATNTSKSS
jgi:hypothetical protein